MKAMRAVVVSTAVLLGIVAGCKHEQVVPQPGAAAAVSGPFSSQELQQFVALEAIDSHAHAFQSDPAFFAMLKKLNVKMIDILVVDDQSQKYNHLSQEAEAGWKFVKGSDGSAVFCTSFDPYKWNEPGFAAAANKQLDKDFSQGAIAVKIWKNIGMEIKDAK